MILCPDPREKRRIAHLLLPELGFGITTGAGDRRIHLEKLGPPPSDREIAEARELNKLHRALLDAAQRELALAKEDHDRLEAAISPHVNFSGVDAYTEELISRVFGER